MRTLILCVVLGLVGCGSKKSGDSGEAPPPKPAHGAPVAFTATNIKPGDNFGGAVDVKGYNFHDKDVGQYMLLFRYFDDKGGMLKVKPGTPFEKTHGFMSLSGNKYKCPAKGWCSFKVDNLDVPAGAAKAEVVAVKVTAYKDASSFEDKPLIDMSSMEWPGEGGAGAGGDAAKPAEGAGSAAAPEAGGSAAGSAEGSAAGSAATP